MTINHHWLKQHAATMILLLGIASAANGGWIQLKAVIAQWMIQTSWAAALSPSGEPNKPWPWADTYPVARLVSEQHNVDLIVLNGVHGESLAFGPGMVNIGASDSKLIAAHRDTHFNWLKQLHPGDSIKLQTRENGWQSYQVDRTRVADSRYEQLHASHDMTLSTCYPFDSLSAGGPERFVVSLSRTSPL